MDQGLVDQLRSAAASAYANLPVVVAYLYGSWAAGRPRADSDIDVGVLIDASTALDPPDQLTSRCTDALASASGLGGIETTVLNSAPLRFLGRVLRQRVVLYSRDEPARVEYESRIGRMADDVEVWASELDRELLAAIAEGRR